MAIDTWLLEILVCPESKKPLVYFEEPGFLFCPASRLRYPIEEDIPVMLVEKAERLDEDASAALLVEAKSRKLPGSEAY